MRSRLSFGIKHLHWLALGLANPRKPRVACHLRRRLRIDRLEERRMLAVVLPDMPNVQHPSDNPSLPAAFETFTPPVTPAAPSLAAPQFAQWLHTAGPGQTLTVAANQLSTATGANFGNDSEFLVYGQTQAGNGKLLDGQIQQISATGAAVTIDPLEPANSMYLVWAKNAAGTSLPIAVNRTEAWWAGPSSLTAGSIGSIYGQNLTQSGAATPTSYVYLQPTNGTKGQWLTVTSANPYKVDFQVPVGLANGTYQLWAHNGEGGRYGWSAPVTITVVSPWTRNGDIYNVKSYGALGNGVADDSAAIAAALQAAQADPGSTLYFPAGTYMISQGFAAPVNIDWAGAGMNSSIIKLNSNFNAAQVIGGAAEFAEFRNLTIDANFNLGAGASNILLVLPGSHDVKFTNVKLVAQTPDSQAATVPAYCPLSMATGSNVSFQGCDFVESGGLFLGVVSQLFFNSCTFEGVTDAGAMLGTWGGQQIAVTNCIAKDHNDTVADGWAAGRFFVQEGLWGVSSQIYLGNNSTVDLAPRIEGANVGEQVLFENSLPSFQNTPTSVTSNTAVLPGSAFTQYEQGTAFIPTVAGKVTAIRFYKAAGESGSHTGHLWDSSGNLLATVTFTGETGSGWQTATLSNPVTLTANAQYVVSVDINSHFLAKTTAGPFTSGPLKFVEGLTSDPNVFPTQSTGQTYFVDVRFTPIGSVVSDSLFNANATAGLAAISQPVNPVGDFVQIIAGTGVGEQRKIIAFNPATQTVTIDSPWSVLPNSTSHIEFNQAVTDVAIYSNSFSGKTANVQAAVTQDIYSAQFGVDFWNDATGDVVADNQFTNLLRGVGFTSHQAGTNSVSVANFNLVAGNTLTNVLVGFALIDPNGPPDVSQTLNYGTGMIGNVFRDNSMNNIATYAFNDMLWGDITTPGTVADDLTVFEDNTGTNVHEVAALNQGAPNRHTNAVIYNNNFALGNAASAGSVAVDLGTGTSQPPLLQANTFQNYPVPYRQNSAQAAIGLPQRVVALVASSTSATPTTSVSVENGGAGPLIWTATSDSKWLTVTPIGYVASQAAKGLLTLSANPSGLSAGTYKATVSITGISSVTGPSLFASLVPAVSTALVGTSQELATKIHTTQAIHVTAIRFYKAASESGSHVGTLWDAAGDVFAQVTFTNETSSGWQTAILSTPITLAANADYYVGTNINRTYVDSAQSAVGPLASNGLSVTGGYYGPAGLLPTLSSPLDYFVDLSFYTTAPAVMKSITVSLTVPSPSGGATSPVGLSSAVLASASDSAPANLGGAITGQLLAPTNGASQDLESVSAGTAGAIAGGSQGGGNLASTSNAFSQSRSIPSHGTPKTAAHDMFWAELSADAHDPDWQSSD